jgi:hypothetical protein
VKTPCHVFTLVWPDEITRLLVPVEHARTEAEARAQFARHDLEDAPEAVYYEGLRAWDEIRKMMKGGTEH